MLMNLTVPSPASAAPGGHRFPFLSAAYRVARSVLRGLERRRQIRALSALNDHLLRDVGLSRDDVEAAASRSFWAS